MSNTLLPSATPESSRPLSWWPLLRSFRLAFRLRQLLLAAAGLALTTAGLRAIEPHLPGGPYPVPPQPWEVDLGFTRPTPLELVARGVDDPLRLARTALGNVRVPLGPARDFIGPARDASDPRAEWSEVLGAGLRWFFWVAMWSVFGTAICRSAAVEFAREQSTHTWGALRFGAVRAPAVLGGLLLPMVAVVGLGGLLALGGLLSRLPYAGPTLLAVVWGLQLLVGVLLMVVLLGLACGWPLMFATIAVEGTDAFDALSRSYNYLYERPLRQLGQVAVTLVLGSFATFCVLLMAQWVVQLTLWGTSWGASRDVLNEFALQVPALLRADPVSSETDAALVNPGQDAGGLWALSRWVARGWFRLLATLVTGFVYSFFFSSVTVMYFLLRQSVDGNDLDEVYLGNEPEPDDLLPLVGAAALGIDLAKVGQVPPPCHSPPNHRPPPLPGTPVAPAACPVRELAQSESLHSPRACTVRELAQSECLHSPGTDTARAPIQRGLSHSPLANSVPRDCRACPRAVRPASPVGPASVCRTGTRGRVCSRARPVMGMRFPDSSVSAIAGLDRE